jgi:hypothetical protein
VSVDEGVGTLTGRRRADESGFATTKEWAMSEERADQAAGTEMRSLCGTHIVVDGERLVVEDTVMHAVITRHISDDFLDYGSDTYWCVNDAGRHRVVRASEIAVAC